MADKEEKNEWKNEILVPLDGLGFDGGKKEDDNYDSGAIVRIKDWDKPKINPDEYKKPKSVKDSLLKALREGRLEAEYNARRGELERKLISTKADYLKWKRLRGEMDDLEAAYKEVKDPGKTRLCGSCGRNIAEELGKYPNLTQCPHCGGNISRKRGWKGWAIAVLSIAIGIFIGKGVANKPTTEAVQKTETVSAMAVAQQSTASKYQVGKYVEFGSYPYDANGTVRPIEWRVLANDGSKALLITKNGIDGVPYLKPGGSITWKDSTIRKWLNERFINDAFTDEQRSRIIERRIKNNDNAKNKTRGGEDTDDKLFLLSIEEANTYFKSNDDRKAYPTPYANLKTEDAWPCSGPCRWWLRSPGFYQDYAALVGCGGGVKSDGDYVNNDYVAVRVALWLDLKNL